MPNGPAARPEKSKTKPLLDQRQHILDHHLGIAIINQRVRLSYVQECGDQNCPLPHEISIMMCRRPPCEG